MCLSTDVCMCAVVRSNKIETKYAEKTELQQANYSKWTKMKKKKKQPSHQRPEQPLNDS